MPSKKHKPEEIIGKLREAEIVLAHGAASHAVDLCLGARPDRRRSGTRRGLNKGAARGRGHLTSRDSLFQLGAVVQPRSIQPGKSGAGGQHGG